MIEPLPPIGLPFTRTCPVHFVFKFKSILASLPVASIIGQFQVTAFDIVISFTAQDIAACGNFISSLTKASAIYAEEVVFCDNRIKLLSKYNHKLLNDIIEGHIILLVSSIVILLF